MMRAKPHISGCQPQPAHPASSGSTLRSGIAQTLLLTLLLPCLLMGAPGCSADEEGERARWLQSTLVDDNYRLILRNPFGVEGKFAKMAQTPYRYFRGTAPQYLRDVTEPGGAGYVPTAYGSAAASDVLLVGDPHPENIGSYLPDDGDITIDFNDFDAARYGPFHFDVRRLALGFWVVGEMMLQAGLLDPEQRDAMVQAVSDGYVEEIQAQASGAEPLRVKRTSAPGRVLDDLMRRAQRDGLIKEELLEFTELENESRQVVIGFVEPEPAMPEVMLADGMGETNLPDSAAVLDGMVEPTPEETRLIERLLQRYPESLEQQELPPGAFEILDIGRRIGPGVSSYPLLRFYVVTEGPTASRDDDWLLEIKEVTDPPAILALMNAGLIQGVPRYFDDNGERVVQAQRALQITSYNDPLLGWASDGSHSFRIRNRTKFQKGVDVARLLEKLYEGEWAPNDMIELSFSAGQLLARAHAGSTTASGRNALTVIHNAIDQPAGFVDETTSFTNEYGPRLMLDYALFLELLEDHGPLLGVRP